MLYFPRSFHSAKESMGGGGVNRSLVMSKLDLTNRATLYKQMESQILEVLSGGPGAK